MGSKTKTVQTTQDTTREIYQPQRDQLDYAYGQARSIYDRNAGPRPLLQQAQQSLTDAANDPWLANARTNGVLDQVGLAPLRATARGDYLTQNNPYFQQMVDNSIAAARPSIDAAFAGSGRLGSGAHANAFADAAARAATSLGYQDYQQERGNQLQAARLLNQLGLQDASARTGLLGLPAQFLQQANAVQGDYDWQNAANFQQLIGQPIFTKENTVGTQPVQQQSPFLTAVGAISSLLGGGGKAAEGAVSLFKALSDARAKDDIRPVGMLNNGLPVYAYRYKGQPGTQIGLLAQEVAQVRPEAVGPFGNTGLLGVDYDRAVR